MTRFMGFINSRYLKGFRSYCELCDWLIHSTPDFWAAMWDFAEIKPVRGYETFVDGLRKFRGAEWFVGARLDFGGNLLRQRG